MRYLRISDHSHVARARFEPGRSYTMATRYDAAGKPAGMRVFENRLLEDFQFSALVLLPGATRRRQMFYDRTQRVRPTRWHTFGQDLLATATMHMPPIVCGRSGQPRSWDAHEGFVGGDHILLFEELLNAESFARAA